MALINVILALALHYDKLISE